MRPGRRIAPVSVTGRGDGDFLAGDGRQRRFQRVLHAAALRLRLPAAKADAAIFQTQYDSHATTHEAITTSKQTREYDSAVAACQRSVSGM
jgi:hypothetical protein